MNHKTVLFSFFFTFSLLSCDHQMVYDHYNTVENSSWTWDDPSMFSFEISDTTSYNNIFIRLRHTVAYPLSNLYMFVEIEGPSGQSMKDTINFILAENSGKWIGRGIGNIRELGYLYRKNTKFPEPGTYHISLEQAMRLPKVPVKQVGIRIEKVQ